MKIPFSLFFFCLLLIFKNYELRYFSDIKINKNNNIIKYYLTLKWLGLTNKVLIHLTGPIYFNQYIIK
jgi:hypothetical protein